MEERLPVVVVFFEIQMVDELKVTPRRLELVMHYMLRCGVCIWGWTWLGGNIFLILLWKVTQRY
jgi:hypothetical protein